MDPTRDEPPGAPPQRDHGGHDAPAGEEARYWRHAAVPGVDLLRATYVTHRYARHAHETYTLALIEDGVEEFRYGGSLLRAGRGAVALLNPEMVHTGQAGVPGGWSYRVLYPAVSLVREVSRGTDRIPGNARSSRTRSSTTRRAPGWSAPPTWPPSTATRWPRPACCTRPWPGCCASMPGPGGGPGPARAGPWCAPRCRCCASA